MRECWFDVDGGRVHGVRWTSKGPRGRARHTADDGCDGPGLPLLLLHGLGGSTINWELVGGALASRVGGPVIAVDLPGFGRSRLGDRRATVGANGQVVARLLEGIGTAVLVGNSMGGAIAIGVAARRADLVSGLVLVDPALPRRGRGALPSVTAIPATIGSIVSQPTPAGLARVGMRLVFHQPDELDPDVVARLALLAVERGQYDERGRAVLDATRSLLAHTANPHGLWREMRNVRCPVLVVQGRHDRLVPLGVVAEAARHRPDWHLEIFDECGHVPQLEAPEHFVDVVATWVANELGAREPAPGAVIAGQTARQA